MIVVAVRMRVKSPQREELIELAQKMVAPSQGEDGCISYNFFADTLDPNAFLFFEEWESREALAAHSQTGHFLRFSNALPDLLESRSHIRVYDVTNADTP